MKSSGHVRSLFAIAAAMTATVGLAGSAHAVTGYVTGKWEFWNTNGNYCPSANTCTGARYPQSNFDKRLPVSNGSVWIVDTGGALLGNGGTDDAGNYTVSWSRSTFPAQIRVLIFPFHKNSRFFFANTAGQWINNTTSNLNTAASSSAGSPQNVGTWFVGSSAASDPFYNAYWAAEWQWRNVMNLVGVLQSNFTNVEVRGFANTIAGYTGTPGTCNSSCAVGSTKRVQLDVNAGFSPQARAMHELGHIATYVTHAWQVGTDYTWAPPGQPAGPATWCQNCPEWGSASFEEAFATHYGSIAFWWDNATTPTTCLSSIHCYNAARTAPAADTNIEASSYPFSTNNCGTTAANPESRWPLSAMRFFWDVFDNHNDADGDWYSANNGDFWKHLHNLAWYPEGTGFDQIEEPWNAAKTSLSEPDGRGSVSYSDNYGSNVTSVNLLRVDNCSPQ